MKEFKNITMEEIEAVWQNANFGSMSKMDVVRSGLLKAASGYHQGYTSQQILFHLGLLDTDSKEPKLTKKGQHQLWEWFKDGQRNV